MATIILVRALLSGQSFIFNGKVAENRSEQIVLAGALGKIGYELKGVQKYTYTRKTVHPDCQKYKRVLLVREFVLSVLFQIVRD